MQLLELELCAVTRNIWSAVVGIELERVAVAPAAEDKTGAVVGRVQLSGGWQGAVVVRCAV